MKFKSFAKIPEIFFSKNALCQPRNELGNTKKPSNLYLQQQFCYTGWIWLTYGFVGTQNHRSQVLFTAIIFITSLKIPDSEQMWMELMFLEWLYAVLRAAVISMFLSNFVLTKPLLNLPYPYPHTFKNLKIFLW